MKNFPLLSHVFKMLRTIRFILFSKVTPNISKYYRYDTKWFYINRQSGKREKLLPNLAVIGAPRCGTTSLYHYLKQHPEIFMSSPLKEPCFYSSRIDLLKVRHRKTHGVFYSDHYDLLKNCMLQGYAGEKYFGDATTLYTMADFAQRFQMAQNMHKAMPSMKIIYQLRNPFDRMISHYRQVVTSGRESRTYAEFVEHDGFAVSNSLYFDQIQTYLKYFPAEQILITQFEEMKDNTPHLLSNLFSFLSIADEKINAGRQYNASPNKQSFGESDFLLPASLFSQLKSRFSAQTEQLNRTFGTDLQWDFSEKRWAKD